MTNSPTKEDLDEALKDTTCNDDLTRAYFYHKAFTPEQCEQISAADTSPELTEAILEQQKILMPGYQYFMQGQVDVLALNETNRWLHEYVHNVFRVVRDKHYHFEIDRAIGTQLLTLEAGQTIGHHSQLGEGYLARRKIALVAFLTPPEAYDGGAFEIIGMPDSRDLQKYGTILVLPAFSVARITKVSRGPLKLLLSWVHGTQRFC